MPWLKAVAARISYDIAAVEWKLYVERANGRPVRNAILQRAKAPRRAILLKQMVEQGDVEEIGHHPALDLLDKANAIQTGLQMRKVTQIHMDLVGDAFWLLERDALGTPVAVWPLPPHWVVGTPTPRRPSFRVSFRAWQGEIPATEIVWFSDVDPLNPYGRGSGTAQSLADELETDEYAARHTKAFFYNRARPDLIVYPKGGGDLREEQVERLEEQWAAHTQGFWRAFRPFFLRREVEIKELDQNFRSQQLVQLREFERNTILQIFGVSPETLGIISPGSNRATITMGDTIYGRRVLVPRLEMLRTVMQERLMPEYDERLILDYESPVTRDHELELEAGKTAPWALSIDEWRERAGLEPLPDERGEGHMVPSTLTVVTDDQPLGAPLAPEAEEPDEMPEPEDVADDGGDENDIMDAEDEQDASAARTLAKAGDEDAAIELRKFWVITDANDPQVTQLADSLVPGYQRAQARAFRRLAAHATDAALEAAVRANSEESVLSAFGGEAALRGTLANPLLAHGEPAFMRAAGLALSALKPRKAPQAVALQDVNPEAVAWARREAARLVKGIGPEQREAIRVIIAAAQQRGLKPAEVARRLRQVVGLLPAQVRAIVAFEERLAAAGLSADVVAGKVARYSAAQMRLRVARIARTEIISSTNHGQQALWELAKQRGVLPAETTRVWIATHDRTVCDICEELDGVEAGLSEPFPGGSLVPPAHPNCLPGDSFVAAGGRIAAASERWYQGNLVVIRTAAGQQLRCTPNHPVLTDSGWVAAGMLHEGQQVISSRRRELVLAGDVHDIHVPTRFHEVAEAFRVSPTSLRRSVVTAAEDFHGDGINGEVAVVWTDGQLRNSRQPALGQDVVDAAFQDGHMSTPLRALSAPRQFISRRYAAARCAMCRLRETIAIGLAEFLPSPPIAFADFVAAGMGSGHMLQPRLACRQRLPQSLRTLTTRSAHSGRDRFAPQNHASFGQDALNREVVDAVPSRDRLERLVGEVGADNIVSVRRERFAGHVYNLQAESGWYLANGIITHNCRCAVGLSEVK